jgi:hypothetical protein
MRLSEKLDEENTPRLARLQVVASQSFDYFDLGF